MAAAVADAATASLLRAPLLALMCLSLASVWVGGAAMTSVAFADLAWEGGACGRGFPVINALIEVSVVAFLSGFLLILVVLMLVLPAALGFLAAAARARAESNQISGPSIWKMLRHEISGLSMASMLRDPVALGLLANLPFVLLTLVDCFVMMVLSPAKGSHTDRIGTVIVDVGILGSMPINCLVTIPSLAVKLWRVWSDGECDAPADSIV